MRPCDCDTTSCLKSAGESSRPFSRIVRSSSCPSSRPTGDARFCDCSACTTCPTLTPAACRSRGRISTTSSRSIAPTRFTVATPVMPRSRRVMPGSAMRVSSAPVRPGDESVSDRIGRSAGIELREDRLLHLRRQVVANLRDLVANLLRRQPRVLREVELDDDVGEAVERVRAHPVDAADAGDHLLDRIDDLTLDDIGRRAGIRNRHHHDRGVDLGILVGVELNSATMPNTTSISIATMVRTGRLMAVSEMNM